VGLLARDVSFLHGSEVPSLVLLTCKATTTFKSSLVISYISSYHIYIKADDNPLISIPPIGGKGDGAAGPDAVPREALENGAQAGVRAVPGGGEVE
jgi:hypothetical protein